MGQERGWNSSTLSLWFPNQYRLTLDPCRLQTKHIWDTFTVCKPTVLFLEEFYSI